MMRARGLDPDLDEYKWQIDSALNIARGISFVNTLRLPEIIASATAEKSYKGNYLYDLAAYVNPQWQWAWGRGGRLEGHGLELPVLRLIDIPKVPKHGVLGRILGLAGKFVPKDIQDKVAGNIETETEKFAASWLDRQNEYGQLLRILGLGGMHTRAGGRINDGLKELRKDIHEMIANGVPSKGILPMPGVPIDTDDQLWYDNYLITKVGAGAAWYFSRSRADDELKKAFVEALYHHGHIDKPWNELSEDRQEGLLTEFGSGEEDIKIHAFKRNQSLFELGSLRELQYQGDTFYALLKRSPLDFMISMTQLVPEIESIKVIKDPVTGAVTRHDAIDYWFADPASFTGTHKANIEEFQGRMRDKWGPHYKRIKQMAGMWKEVRAKYVDSGLDPVKDQAKISEKFRNHLSFALERVRNREDLEMVASDIMVNDSDIGAAEKVALENALRTLFFDTDPNIGLLSYFKDAGDEHHTTIRGGLHEEIDEDNFFFRLANVWFREDQVGVFPTSAEIDHRMIFKYVNLSGDNMNKRLHGDWPAWMEARKNATKLDEILLRAANSHSLKEVMELHHELNAFKYIQGERYMHQANYYIAALVGRFFQEHYAARMPFPIGTIAGFMADREISLSKLSVVGRSAMSMNTDELNKYFLQLSKAGMIAEHGPWSYDQISQAIGVDFPKMFVSEIAPNFSIYFLLLLWWTYLRKAEKDAEGGGGGGGGGGGHH